VRGRREEGEGGEKGGRRNCEEEGLVRREEGLVRGGGTSEEGK
jgi:hypothetical protein